YDLPMSGDWAGRRIRQYFDSSDGMVQPTRMVCCAPAELAPATSDVANAPARIHFEDIRTIMPAPLWQIMPCLRTSLSWFKQSGKPSRVASHTAFAAGRNERLHRAVESGLRRRIGSFAKNLRGDAIGLDRRRHAAIHRDQ